MIFVVSDSELFGYNFTLDHEDPKRNTSDRNKKIKSGELDKEILNRRFQKKTSITYKTL
jgi:hypothetical protein